MITLDPAGFAAAVQTMERALRGLSSRPLARLSAQVKAPEIAQEVLADYLANTVPIETLNPLTDRVPMIEAMLVRADAAPPTVSGEPWAMALTWAVGQIRELRRELGIERLKSDRLGRYLHEEVGSVTRGRPVKDQPEQTVEDPATERAVTYSTPPRRGTLPRHELRKVTRPPRPETDPAEAD